MEPEIWCFQQVPGLCKVPRPAITVDILQGKDMTLLLAPPDSTRLTKSSCCSMGSTLIIVTEMLLIPILSISGS